MTLLEACWNGDLSQVEHLLMQGCDVNQRDIDGSTPLQLAIKQEHESIISKLLEYSPDWNVSNNKGEKISHTAARVRNVSIVKLLICKGMIFDAKSIVYSSNEGVLYCILQQLATTYGIPELLSSEIISDIGQWKNTTGIDIVAWSFLFHKKNLLQAFIKLNFVADQTGYKTPLHDAVSKNELNEVKKWVKQGADADLANEFGKTPAEIAFKKNYKEIFQYLLQHITEERKQELISQYKHLIIENPSKEKIDMLIPFVDCESKQRLLSRLLEISYRNNDSNSIVFCWKQGCVIDQQGWDIVIHNLQDWDTFPVLNEEMGKVKEYVQQWNRGEKKVSVLEWAIEHQVHDILKLYLNMGFLSIAEKLIISCIEGNLPILDELLLQGCDINKVFMNRTPIMCAIQNRQITIVKKLISNGAKIKIQLASGVELNALTCALQTKESELVDALAPALQNIQPEEFWNACKGGALEVIKKFVRTQNLKNIDVGLLYAIREKQLKVVECLLEQRTNDVPIEIPDIIDLALEQIPNNVSILLPYISSITKLQFYKMCAYGNIMAIEKFASSFSKEILDSAIYISCVRKQMPAIELLLKFGANGCARSLRHHSALYVMCQYGNYEGAKQLLEMNRPDTIKPSILRLVVQQENADLFRLLIPYVSAKQVRRIIDEEAHFMPSDRITQLQHIVEEVGKDYE